MKWKPCRDQYKCSNLVTKNLACHECFFKKGTPGAYWNINNFGHWKMPGDKHCRCCDHPKEDSKMNDWYYICDVEECSNELTLEQTWFCGKCWAIDAGDIEENWKDQWGHWKMPDDVVCRCCNPVQGASKPDTWELSGGL